jgi:uncharacterized protein (TIRG00374 family)
LALGAWLLRSRLAPYPFDWHTFRATLAGLQWGWLAAAWAGSMAGYFLRAVRWGVLMRPVKPHPNLWNLFSATLIGFTAITLLGRAGEFARPYLIAAKEKVPLASQLAAWLLERIYDLLTSLAIFGFALSRVRRSSAALGPALSWVFATGGWFVAVLSILTLGLLAAFRHFSIAMRQRLLDALAALPEHHLKKADRLITAFVQGVESTKSYRALLLVVFYTALEWAVIALTTFCVVRAFGSSVDLSWLDVLIFLGFLSFGGVVQIPGIGGGVQVVTVLVLTELFRVSLEISSSIALIFWIVSFVVVVPFGLLLALREGLRWSALKPLSQEVTAL